MNIALLVNSAIARSSIANVPVYAVTMPDAVTLPAITFQTISNQSQQTFTGLGAQRLRVQVDVWASSYSTATTTRDSLIAALDGFTGTLSDAQVIDGVSLNQVMDSYNHDALQFRCMVEFFVYYTL